MSIIYRNADLSDYYLNLPKHILNKEYTVQFSTSKPSLPRSNYETFNNRSDFLYDGTVYGQVEGIIVSDTGGKWCFVNTEEIVLPTEIGETVEGSLECIDFNQNSEHINPEHVSPQ